MTNYTPTTDEVRAGFSSGALFEFEEIRGARFDRWLAAHDAEVRAAQIKKDATIAEDAPGSDAAGYYASEAHSGYNEAQGHIERAIRAQLSA